MEEPSGPFCQPQLSRVLGVDMKAFLLAAGHGTRLRPLTDTIPKCLVPIRGTPMLEIWLELCRRTGIDEVLINLHSHTNLVKHFLVQKDPAVRVRISEEPTLLGSAGTLLANREWVRHDPMFWIFYGDVLTTADLCRMLEFHCRHQPVSTIGLYQVKDAQRCGIVTFDDEFVVRDFVEKPSNPKSNWAFSGIMIAAPELFANIPSRYPVDLGFDVLPKLVGRMRAYPIADYLTDVGTIETYDAAQTAWPGLSG